MIKDKILVASAEGKYMICVLSPNGELSVRCENNEHKKRLEEALNRTFNVPLLPIAQHKLYPTGKTTPLEIAAAMTTVSSDVQFVEIPQEVIDELRTLQGNPQTPTISATL